MVLLGTLGLWLCVSFWRMGHSGAVFQNETVCRWVVVQWWVVQKAMYWTYGCLGFSGVFSYLIRSIALTYGVGILLFWYGDFSVVWDVWG